jgi:tRNA nucleotidyltransferase (CCA-adding enzyme)
LRRDFTINAFALADDGEVIDLYGGLADLEAQILRAVGNPTERFNEDALRIMRGLRFAAVLEFRPRKYNFCVNERTCSPLVKNID